MKLVSILLFIGMVFGVGCGTPSKPGNADPTTPAIEQLRLRIETIKSWAPVCSKVQGEEPYPALDPNGDVSDCGDGDGVYINGFLCLVGIEPSCEMVKNSIGEDGRLWRSPFRRLNGDSNINTSSRDQLNGLLAYLVATKDTYVALRFQDYLKANGNKLCPLDTDGRCNLTSVSYGLLFDVYRYIGLSTPLEWQAQYPLLSNTLKFEAVTVSPGYPMYLIGQQVLLMIKVNDFTSNVKSAADSLFSAQSDNPFYRYLSKGADLDTINLALSQAPSAKPIPANQWSISRATSEQAWLNSAGWDYVFLYNLFVGAK